ncbi:SCO family protein [Aridibaculum aurantiacum]|uniref:SCO family protein n=1 Tax=Aridibaculum aurantiacum TaxID=2810307 RepID=UPI001A95670A|nr:SCO family protein [Aridibaculum aurantiacum]
MNKKAALALAIAILIPLTCYLVIKFASDESIAMPPRYFADSVITKTVDGKTTTDTVWHKVGDITLVNQLGDTVSLYDIKGKMIVADFFFTRCPSICPTMTRHMAKMQQSFSHMREGRRVIDSTVVNFLSFSVDPERDSVPQLKQYADRFGVNHDNWWMLTGPKKEIYDFALNELKLGLQDGEGVDSSFIHSSKFVLIDRDYVVRGYYNGLDTTSLKKLSADIGLLMLEKDKKKKRNLFRK